MLRRTFLAGIAGATSLASMNPAHAAKSDSIAWQRLPLLNRGFNIPRWIGSGRDEAPGLALLQKLRQIGFAAVRLPVDPLDLVAPNGSDIAAQTVEATHMLQQLGYSVTLDMHGVGELGALFKTDPALARIYVEHAWDMLLKDAKDLPEATTFFELLNEPPMEADSWQSLGTALAQQVRAACPRHTLLWGPTRYQALWQLEDSTPPDDQNLIIAVHYYEPMSFTHQSADWAGPVMGALRQVSFPASADDKAIRDLKAKLESSGHKEALDLINRDFLKPWDAKRLHEDFAKAGRWSVQNNRPMVLNEFGVYGVGARPADRAQWIRAVREGAEKAGIAWTYWEMDGGFGFVNDRKSASSLDFTPLTAMLGD